MIASTRALDQYGRQLAVGWVGWQVYPAKSRCSSPSSTVRLLLKSAWTNLATAIGWHCVTDVAWRNTRRRSWWYDRLLSNHTPRWGHCLWTLCSSVTLWPFSLSVSFDPHILECCDGFSPMYMLSVVVVLIYVKNTMSSGKNVYGDFPSSQ